MVSINTLLSVSKYSFSTQLNLRVLKAFTRADASACSGDEVKIFFTNPYKIAPEKLRTTPTIPPVELPTSKEPSVLIFRSLFFGKTLGLKFGAFLPKDFVIASVPHDLENCSDFFERGRGDPK
ncbi:bHLH-MYC_N domain-containing protein [Psidium guajava]|nr:bHLH-MYC_N domain-containing protein [Psidium guajava]